MTRVDHARCFQEALTKAFAATSPRVRAAYFDLASFYHEKLGGSAHLYATSELRCLLQRGQSHVRSSGARRGGRSHIS